MSIFRYKNEQDEWFELPFLRGPQGPSGVDGKDGVSIATTTINEDGKLVINYSDGTSDTLGKVVGENGKDGTNGLNGENGQDGVDGVGVTRTEINAEGELVITYSNGISEILGTVVGADGQNGSDGKDGTDGHTPRKGTDYFTEDDKQELVQLVLESLPSAEEMAF